MARTSLLANTYLIPQVQQQQPAAPKPFQDEIGDPAQGLAQIDGTTEQYFDKWAALKGFARDVWENYGIDVRYPDPSVPESNRLHRIYLKSIADLKHQGARLQTDQQMYNQMLQRGDQIKFDPTTQHASEMKPGTDFIPNELDPIVGQTNDKLQQQYYDDKSLNEAKGIYENTKAQFLKNATSDPQNKEYWMRQIQGLTPPTSAHKQFSPYAGQSGTKDKNKINAAGAFLKKTTNLLNGTSDSYSLSDTVFGPNGERTYVSEDTKGDTYGGKKIVRYEYQPETKQTAVVVVDKDGNTQKVDLTGADPMSLAKGYVSENPRYASSGEYLDIYADQAGIFKETGEVDATSLITPDANQRFDRMGKEITADGGNTFKLKQLKDELSTMETHWYGNDTITKTDSKGIPIKIKIKDDKGIYSIENIKQIEPGKKPAFYKKFQSMGKQALVNYLSGRGAHLGEEPRAAQEAAPQAAASAPTETEAQRLLREYREKKKSSQ
jgi:hypothetical protein